MNRISGSEIFFDDEDEEFKIPSKSFSQPKVETNKMTTRSVTSAVSNVTENKKGDDSDPILTEKVVYESN